MSDHNVTAQQTTGRLRLLATTDLHMQLLGYDYFADRRDDGIGLLHLADQITALRSGDEITTLLFDNGDLIQGNPLADHLAGVLKPGDGHPMIAALNALNYDAMTLGNHDFDYGVPFLQQTLTHADFPVVSANIMTPQAGTLAQPFALLHRQLMGNDGALHPIRIGVTGFGPPQIADWDDRQQCGQIAVTDIVAAARAIVPRMRAAGAQLIIALAHTGIGAHDHQDRMENAAVPLAAVAGIDVVIAGHTHAHFPDQERPATPPVDPGAGTLHGKPTVLAGAYGKALGVIDLTLTHDDAGWRISNHHARMDRPKAQSKVDSPLQDKLRGLVAGAHHATLREMRKPVGHTQQPIQSYFATVTPDLPQQILAQAIRHAVLDRLADQLLETPVLAATSPFRFGGHSGLGEYIAIPPGPITLHDAAAIFPFNDTAYVVRRSGAQIREWLERAASYYNQIIPGSMDSLLINPQNAGYHCDTLHGLRYQIDLSAPARFDQAGNAINQNARRITQLTHQGNPVHDDDTFVVVTNSFRAKGGGGFPTVPAQDILPLPSMKIRDILISALAKGRVTNQQITPAWGFAPLPDTTADFIGARAARSHLPDTISWVADVREAEARYRITF